MSSGQDVRFSEERVAQGQNLTNKLWNASRLILLRVDAGARAAAQPLTVEDRWILSRLARARAEIDARIERYDFSRAALELYDFVYAELCDWYLELVKPRLYDGDPAAAGTLLHVLTETVTMAHPVIPFVTEEIYSHIPGSEGLLAARVAPPVVGHRDGEAENAIGRAIEAIQALRAWRDSAGVRPSAVLPARLGAAGYEETVAHLARLARLEVSGEAGEAAASIPIPGGAIEVLPSADLDLEAAERKRETKRAELEKEVEISERKLANRGFVEKAPPEVVQKVRDRLGELRSELGKLAGGDSSGDFA
jgi:valyl-tRNA synthetase